MKLALIDGSAYVHRAFHALPPLSRRDGTPVGAVHGFCSMLWDLIRYPGDRTHMAVVWDAGRSGRTEVYADYKANRGEKVEDLKIQFKLVERACEAFGVAQLRLSGYEADDVIATVAREVADRRGGVVRIYSGDKDLYQLLRPGVEIFDPGKKVLIGEAECVQKFGVVPSLVPHVQALLGDAVDNVPGVASIGAKTAAQLVAYLGHVENILTAAANPRMTLPCKPKQRQALINDAENARLSLRLVTLDDQVPVGIDPAALECRTVNYGPILEFFEEMEFEQLTEQVISQAA